MSLKYVPSSEPLDNPPPECHQRATRIAADAAAMHSSPTTNKNRTWSGTPKHSIASLKYTGYQKKMRCEWRKHCVVGANEYQ